MFFRHSIIHLYKTLSDTVSFTYTRIDQTQYDSLAQEVIRHSIIHLYKSFSDTVSFNCTKVLPGTMTCYYTKGRFPILHMTVLIFTEVNNEVEVMGQKIAQMEVNQQVYHQKPPPPLQVGQPGVANAVIGQTVSDTHLSASSSCSSLADVQQMGQSGPVAVTSPTMLLPDRRSGQGVDTNQGIVLCPVCV